jgi:hypothetical protein
MDGVVVVALVVCLAITAITVHSGSSELAHKAIKALSDLFR